MYALGFHLVLSFIAIRLLSCHGPSDWRGQSVDQIVLIRKLFHRNFQERALGHQCASQHVLLLWVFCWHPIHIQLICIGDSNVPCASHKLCFYLAACRHAARLSRLEHGISFHSPIHPIERYKEHLPTDISEGNRSFPNTNWQSLHVASFPLPP